MTKLPKLFKKTSAGKIQEWEIFIEGSNYWTVYGQQDGKKITGEPTACVSKNEGRANETSPEQQAEFEANAKWTAQKDKHHYVEDVGAIEEETFFKVMLAKNYTDYKDKIKFPAIYQDKLDGLRFVARASGGHSRNGKPLGGMFLIERALQPFFEAYPDAILDGEAFSDEYRSDFQKIVSLIKRDEDKITPEMQDNIEKYLQYHVYDVPRIDGLTEKDNYKVRIACFWEIIKREFPELLKYLRKVNTTEVNSPEEIQSLFEESIANGFEGGILRFDKPYDNKRSANLLKIKEFKDAEFEIVEILEGRGTKANTAGSMTLRLPDGRTFNSNIKGGYDLYQNIWDNQSKLVGKCATCKFFDYSNEGIPRFPYVINIDRESYE